MIVKQVLKAFAASTSFSFTASYSNEIYQAKKVKDQEFFAEKCHSPELVVMSVGYMGDEVNPYEPPSVVRLCRREEIEKLRDACNFALRESPESTEEERRIVHARMEIRKKREADNR